MSKNVMIALLLMLGNDVHSMYRNLLPSKNLLSIYSVLPSCVVKSDKLRLNSCVESFGLSVSNDQLESIFNDLLEELESDSNESELEDPNQKTSLNLKKARTFCCTQGLFKSTPILFESAKNRLTEPFDRASALKNLGIDSLNPTEDEIKKAFNKKALIYHPDRGGTGQDFINLNKSKDILLKKSDCFSSSSSSSSSDIFSGFQDFSKKTSTEEHFDKNPMSSLMNEILYGSLEKAKDLIKQEVDINYQCNRGQTALHYACGKENIELVKMLLEAGADVHIKDYLGNTPLIQMAVVSDKISRNRDKNKSIEIVKILIQAGADINSQQYIGQTALVYAARRNNIEIIKVLIEAGANVNIKDFFGITALMVAAEENNYEVIKILIKGKANIDAQDSIICSTALMYAARKNNIEAIQVLIEQGANLEIKDKQGMTALMYTILKNELDAVNLKNQLEVAKILIKAGVDLNAQNHREMTILMQAVECNNIEMINMLLELGLIFQEQEKTDRIGDISIKRIDLNLQDKDGNTALMKAFLKGYFDIAEILIKAGADVTIKNSLGQAVDVEAVLNRSIKRKITEFFSRKFLK